MAYLYKRNGVWRLTVAQDGGGRRDIGLGHDLARAKILKASIEQACNDRKFKANLLETLKALGLVDPNLAPASSRNVVTWDFAREKLTEYLASIGRARRTVYVYNHALNSLEKHLSPKSPADVTERGVDEWIGKLLTTPSRNKPGAPNLSATAVSAMVRAAKSAFQRFARWKYVSSNPFKDCEMPKCPATLPRPLGEDEIEKILNASNEPLKRCIRILRASGMRPNELYNIPWGRVDLDGQNPRVNVGVVGQWHPKAHTERIIPVTKQLREALGRPGHPEESIAGRNEHGNSVGKNWLERSFRRAVRRAGLGGKKITLYCLRDTYATELALNGAEAHVIAARLGHRDLATSMRYVSMARLNMAAVEKNGKKGV